VLECVEKHGGLARRVVRNYHKALVCWFGGHSMILPRSWLLNAAMPIWLTLGTTKNVKIDRRSEPDEAQDTAAT
jgi:hypothetical protein